MSRAALATSTTDWAMIERRSLAVAGLGIVVCGAAAIFSWPHFLRAYLVAWNFWAGVSLGAFGAVDDSIYNRRRLGTSLAKIPRSRSRECSVARPALPHAAARPAGPVRMGASGSRRGIPRARTQERVFESKCFLDSGRDILCVVDLDCMVTNIHGRGGRTAVNARSRSPSAAEQ